MMFKHLVLICLFSCSAMLGSDGAQIPEETEFQRCGKELLCYFTSKKCIKDLAVAYSMCAGLVLIHELGHAVAAKLLFNSPIDIHLGACTLISLDGVAKLPVLAQVPGLTIHSLNPLVGGFTVISGQDSTPLRCLATILAGPLCGGLASYGAWRYFEDWGEYPITKLAIVTVGMLSNIDQLLIPYQQSDGARALQCFKKYRAS